MTTPIPNNPYRRALITGALAWGVCARPAFALTEGEATGFIARLVADIDKVIADGGSESAMIGKFEALFIRYADVDIMGQYALGVDGRSASAAQKSAFNAAFSRYISRKYGGRFRQFIGGRIEINGARRIKPGFEITTTAHLKGENPIEVIFLVSDKSGKGQFFNMFIEGVNLLLTERAEIGAMLDRRGGDIDKMTADLAKAG